MGINYIHLNMIVNLINENRNSQFISLQFNIIFNIDNCVFLATLIKRDLGPLGINKFIENVYFFIDYCSNGYIILKDVFQTNRCFDIFLYLAKLQVAVDGDGFKSVVLFCSKLLALSKTYILSGTKPKNICNENNSARSLVHKKILILNRLYFNFMKLSENNQIVNSLYKNRLFCKSEYTVRHHLTKMVYTYI